MSQENVEVVRRFIEALPRAQASDDWQPVFAEVDPDVEIDDLERSVLTPSATEDTTASANGSGSGWRAGRVGRWRTCRSGLWARTEPSACSWSVRRAKEA